MHTSNIISKHINHKVFSSFIFILLTMVGILFISRSVGYFEKSVAGQLDPNIILNILILRLPDFLSFLIPFSIFISLYLNFSNQYSIFAPFLLFITAVPFPVAASLPAEPPNSNGLPVTIAGE